MHDIEPYYKWRNKYIAARDSRSPFYGRTYSEFTFTNKVYNYYIHPQWDEFGSATLYLKVLFADYEEGFVIIELIGEWNDCIDNDIMFLKRDVIDPMIKEGLHKFILIVENVLNFHGSDDAYYEEWYEDVADEGGWVCVVNTLPHVADEMKETQLQQFVNFGEEFNSLNWRPHKPQLFFKAVDALVNGELRRYLPEEA
ncbi:hypothetical protein [Phaeodactylibacter luteus]|uniref:Uncharacterized protein n=1 Tax=Phaeodactylibacter luteus TaxID=1564516 RepID=A0A5C6RNH1_9BACT|nr:hypothetical protein [Phaeodactylibacter luteus]TXB62932.1 hypothetical protein FRY97_11350 [Phaeodactylibacter luteus]